ncbi:hypothetical protein P879_04843 [Paragonimus westermani]|uniref:Uncharacterized protein n=1 Tax=Paragonimus westermani TaxID=34504 RepID=A0A8T0D9T5_9TREM|nr:hypothetical protein P879_04843 [Paragonimus westermani]
MSQMNVTVLELSDLLTTTHGVEHDDLTVENGSWVLAMFVILSLVLLLMIVLLSLPKSMQDSVFRCVSRESPDQTFNYIDVGLYKTRHSMYRKEVYSLAMQGNRSKTKREQVDPFPTTPLIVTNRVKQQLQADTKNTSMSEPRTTDSCHRSTVVNTHWEASPTETNYSKRPAVIITLVDAKQSQLCRLKGRTRSMEDLPLLSRIRISSLRKVNSLSKLHEPVTNEAHRSCRNNSKADNRTVSFTTASQENIKNHNQE